VSDTTWYRTDTSFTIGFATFGDVVMPMNLRSVSVVMHFRSKNVKRYYRYAEQRKPLCDIDISMVQDFRDLELVWKEMIGKDGKFTLVVKDHRGRLLKSIGTIIVRGGKINTVDKRSALNVMFKKNIQRIEKEQEADYTL